MNKPLLLLLCLMLSAISAQATGPKYYRYKDQNGKYIISNMLPPEYANAGYDIVTTRGNVLEHIPPKRSLEDIAKEKAKIAAQEAKQQKAEIAKQEKVAQQKRDQQLLQMFSSVADIQRSRDEKISAIEVLEGITRDNIKRQEKQLKKAQQRAENLEQSGSVIPKTLTELLQKTSSNIDNSKNFLQRKAAEKEKIHTEYEALINRYQHISGDSE